MIKNIIRLYRILSNPKRIMPISVFGRDTIGAWPHSDAQGNFIHRDEGLYSEHSRSDLRNLTKRQIGACPHSDLGAIFRYRDEGLYSVRPRRDSGKEPKR